MIKFFNKLKNLIFTQALALSSTTSYGFLASCRNLEKTIDKFKKNAQTDGRMDTRMDRPYFIGPLWLLPEVQKMLSRGYFRRKHAYISSS